jgi:hypothetical protein
LPGNKKEKPTHLTWLLFTGEEQLAQEFKILIIQVISLMLYLEQNNRLQIKLPVGRSGGSFS